MRPNRCPSQYRDAVYELYCSLPKGHETLHRGWNKEWTDEEAYVPPPPPPPPPPPWDGPVFVETCQHCKAKYHVELPYIGHGKSWLVTCPKCRQTGLHWYQPGGPAQKFVPGVELRTRAKDWAER